ncbi:hypothetical protein, partial [Congregibacter sp.]|uniref:hypothetical protein n=1 Tax=Congregibacter sp. TaxID=2744308 RepID=UPI003F6B21CF
YTMEGSGFASVRTGQNLSATFSGAIGGLKLRGDYRLPDIRELGDLSLNAELSGPVPPRIAELSPILEADELADITLRIADVEPGLELELRAELSHLVATLNGTIDNPGSGDGVSLAMHLDADSLPRLAEALGLGPSDEVPLTVTGRLLRDGKRIEVRDAMLDAGENHLTADIVLPEFPATDGGTVHLEATGPDFAFYQKLLNRTPNLKLPYTVQVDIKDNVVRGEYIEGDISVGAHRLRLSGLLDNFPNYAGSELTLEFNSPSIKAIADNAGIGVPDSAVSVDSRLSISDEAVINIQTADITAYDITSQVSGSLNSYPNFDNANIHLSAQIASLSRLGQQLGLAPLGDLPINLAIDIEGQPEDILLRSPELSVGGLQLESSGGKLRYANNALSGELLLKGQLSEINALLGDYASDYTPSGSYSFELTPQLSPQLITISLQNLSGPKVSGDARLELSSDFKLNSQTMLESNLRFEDPSLFLPSVAGLSVLQHPVTLRSVTRPKEDATEINAELHDASGTLLSADIVVPPNIKDQGISIEVSGRGDDLRRLDTHSTLPDQLLSYDIDVSAQATGDSIVIDAKKIALGQSLINGNAHWDQLNKSLVAVLRVPHADVHSWITTDTTKDSTTEKATSPDGRKIPNTAIPRQWLNDYRIDLTLETGPLGLKDPQFNEQSLVEQSKLQFQSGEGKGLLTIEDIQGSRGIFAGEVSIVDAENTAQLQSELTATALPMGIIATGAEYDALPRYEVNSSFTATGENLRELAASLNGEFLMVGGAGTLQKMKLSAATESFVAQIFQTLLPMLAKGQTNMQVKCSVLAARANDGILSLDPGLVFRSEQIDLSAEGQINLRNEKLEITFNNRARKGLGINAASMINPFVAVTGTLAKPTLGLDLASSAISGGAAVASAGVTIIAKPLLERLFSRGNPCKAALERWNEPVD